jgi:hypothetical protein
MPLGQVTLPITFRTSANHRTEFIKLEVANFISYYIFRRHDGLAMKVSSVFSIPHQLTGWVNVRLDLHETRNNFKVPKMYFETCGPICHLHTTLETCDSFHSGSSNPLHACMLPLVDLAWRAFNQAY